MTGSGMFGPFHIRTRRLDIDHSRASSFAVETVEFLVEQNIIMGFLAEWVPMILESLYHGEHLINAKTGARPYFELSSLSNAKLLPEK